MPTAFSDSEQGTVETDLSRIAIEKDWSELALDDGSHLVKANEYGLKLFSREGQIISTSVNDIRFRDEVDAAQNPRFEIPPNQELVDNQFEFLAGSVQFFVGGEIAFAGEILKIESSQKEGENISIKAKNPGRRLEDDIIDLQPDNSVLQDVILKTIDRHNEIDREYSDMVGSEDEDLEGIESIGEILIPSNSFGKATYTEVGSDASKIKRINFKAYTNPDITVKIEIDDPDTEDYVETFDDLDKNNYGEWATIIAPVFPDVSYNIVFEMNGGSTLFDWLVLASEDVTRSSIAPDIETVGEMEFLYERSGEDLTDSVDEIDDDLIVQDGDSYRTRQQAIWYPYAESDEINIIEDEDATFGYAWDGGTGSVTRTMSFSTEDDIEDWEIHARIKRVSGSSTDSFDVIGRVNNTDFSYGSGVPDTDYEWRRIAAGDFTENWPDDNTGNIDFRFEIDSSSEVTVRICSFVMIHGSNSSYDISYSFDNNLTNGQLDSPHIYSSAGTVSFNETTTSDNISTSITEATMTNPTEPVSDWGISQKITEEAEFPSPRNSDSITDAYPYPGVSHRVKATLSSHGEERNNTSPRFGYEPAEIEDFTVDVGTNNLEVMFDQTLTGNRLQVLSELVDDSTFHYRWEGNECHVFQRGAKKSNISLRKEDISSSIGIEDVYSSVEVIGSGGVTSGVIEADEPLGFIDRHKEIRDQDIETELDAQRRAVGFLRDNSTVEYEGEITTMPTFAPVGNMIDGSMFQHGEDMIIEENRYGKRRSNLSLGFKQKLTRKIRGLDRSTTSITRRQTTESN